RVLRDGVRVFWGTRGWVGVARFAGTAGVAPGCVGASGPGVDEDGRDRIRKMLEGVVQAYQERDDVREAVERLNRTDVRTRLEALQASTDATSDQLDRLHETLGFLVQADLLYNPRYELTAGTLERARRDDEDGESIAALLNARAEVVRFTGRAHERSELRAFCDTTERFAAVFVSGPGGVGKTRLAMQGVEDADDSLWRAGFLRRNAPNDPLTASELRRGLKQLDAAGRDLFLVIDYAEGRPDFVAEIVRMWTDTAQTPRQKLRLVLLCRNRDVVLDAVKRLEPDVDTLRGAQAVLRDSLVLGMQNPLAYHEGSAESAEDSLLLALDARQALFAAAQRDMAALLDLPLPSTAPPDRFFEAEAFQLSLYLLVAARRSLDGTYESDRARLLDYALEKEFSYLRRLCRREPDLGDVAPESLYPVVARLTLAMAARPTEEETDTPDLPPPLADLLRDSSLANTHAKREALIRVLSRAYPLPNAPEDDDYADALRPDPLGEAVVYRAYGKRREARRLNPLVFGDDLDPASLASAREVLTRAALALDDTPGPWLTARLDNREVDLIARAMPFYSLSRLSISAHLAAWQVERTKNTAEAADDDDALSRLANALNTLGVRFSNLGRREDALHATEQAVALYQRLAQRNPDAFEPVLAMSLNNLGIRFSNLGRREDALQATEQAVSIRRRLAQRNPDAFEPNLAMSLNNLGGNYSSLGRREDALQATEQAVAIRRRLAQRNPDAFEPDLGNALWTLGNVFNAFDQHESALDPLSESLRLLLPHFERLPPARARQMQGTLQAYVQACQGAGQEPDPSLLAPFVAFMQQLQEQAPPPDEPPPDD
ncbi:MAG: tetratricopeptide repeat protein, partial [Bacteroidota bacterium]